MEYLNTKMIIGILIAGVATLYGMVYFFLYYIKCWKTKELFSFKKILKTWLIVVIIALVGAVIIQLGDNQRKSEFTSEEIHFMNENKSYSQFTESDKKLASAITHKCIYNSDKIFEQCLPKVLPWELSSYQQNNTHLHYSDSDARKYVENNLRSKHNYWMNRK
ncbi:TPA: hypothetical protein ACXI1D_000123 [Proteus mirabilis]